MLIMFILAYQAVADDAIGYQPWRIESCQSLSK